MRALVEDLDSFEQFKSSAVCLVVIAIVAFKLDALSPPWAGDTSLHRNDDEVK